jgi:biotin carboxylase
LAKIWITSKPCRTVESAFFLTSISEMFMSQFTILCLASFDKGSDFMRECKREGCRVLLLTSPRTHDAAWPRESIDELYVLRDFDGRWDDNELVNSVSYIARKEAIDAVVALDDYDLEAAGLLRDHLQLRGFGATITRNFRDKLAMRVKAGLGEVRQPDCVHFVNEAHINAFTARVPLPYILKPRGEASAIGVKKITSNEELWKIYEELGDRRSAYLVEQFLPGEIFHVDALTYDGKVVFACVSKYGKPPLDVVHGGGIFTTATVERGSDDEKNTLKANQELLKCLGLRYGASHTEFIKAEQDGELYFMETAARVGGANIVEMVDAATGVNLWTEWAKIEISYGNDTYKAPKITKNYAGIIISLAKQEHPDTTGYDDAEIVWRMHKPHHVGLIVQSGNHERVTELLKHYQHRFYTDFHTSLPAPDKATA